jgi:3-oxoacyl-[acyl-carrier protein] reductase
MKGIQEKVAIITGGTRGIGLGIAKRFAESGARVAAVYRSDEQAAGQASDVLKSAAGADERFYVTRRDVSKVSDCAAVAAAVAERWGGIDFLVNNAGVFDFSYLDEMTPQFLDRMLDTNLKGTIYMTQAVIPEMKKRKFGRIVNASSISGHFADVGLVAYASAKAGVDMTTRLAAAELGPYGITVNAFAPGIIDTDMTHEMIEQRGDVQVRQIPAGRFGEADDVAGLVLFLCSEEARYVTGEIIGVDGGMMKVQNPYRAIDRASESG